MEVYDAMISPNPTEWLATDERRRLELVWDYHRRIRAPLRRAARETHMLVHVIIENLLLGDDRPALHQTVDRLIGEGLDRHEAIHALGCVLLTDITDYVENARSFSVERYLSELDSLTADSWRRDYG